MPLPRSRFLSATRWLIPLALGSPVAAEDWFGPPTTITFSGHPRDLAGGNFDGDEHPDWTMITQEGQLWVGLGTGVGTFTLVGPIATATIPYRIASGDLNNDGLDDVAFVLQGGTKVYVHYNLGAGILTTNPVLINSGGSTFSVMIGHLDADAWGDVAVGRLRYVDAYWGLGTGFVTTPTTIDASTNPDPECLESTYVRDIQYADFDGDLDGDLAIVSAYTNPSGCSGLMRRAAGYALNLGQRLFAPTPTWLIDESMEVQYSFERAATADIDGDERLDIGVGAVSIPGRYLLNTPLGWTETPAWDEASFIGVAFGDFNADGQPDIVSGGKFSSKVGQGHGAAGFTLAEFLVGVGLGAPAVGNYDASPGLDIVGYGSTTVNLVSNVIYPSAVGETSTIGGGQALRVEPSVVGGGTEQVRFRLLPGAAGHVHRAGPLGFRVVNAGGQTVALLRDTGDDAATAGVTWDLTASDGRRIASGAYRVIAGGESSSLIVIR